MSISSFCPVAPLVSTQPEHRLAPKWEQDGTEILFKEGESHLFSAFCYSSGKMVLGTQARN